MTKKRKEEKMGRSANDENGRGKPITNCKSPRGKG